MLYAYTIEFKICWIREKIIQSGLSWSWGYPCPSLFTSNTSNLFYNQLGFYFQNIGSRNISIYKQPLVLTPEGFLTLKTLIYSYLYPWKFLTLGESWGCCRVRVYVRMKIPKGFTCPSLYLMEIEIQKDEIFYPIGASQFPMPAT